MTDLGCPLGPYPEHPHNYQPFAADMAGEVRTVAFIFCTQCGKKLDVELTPEQQPMDEMAIAWPGGETR